MKAVANSSVLIALSAIGRLSLLRERFPDGLLIPDAVWREVVETGRGRPGALEVREARWIQQRAVRDRDYVKLLRAELDAGEAEVTRWRARRKRMWYCWMRRRPGGWRTVWECGCWERSVS